MQFRSMDESINCIIYAKREKVKLKLSETKVNIKISIVLNKK